MIFAAVMLGGFSAAAGAQPADQIQVSVPVHIRPRAVYDVTIHGFARTRSTAYLFIDYSSCARSFAVERRRAPNESDDYAVSRRFTEISGWRSSSAGIDHACAYLVATRSGRVLASVRRAFTIQ